MESLSKDSKQLMVGLFAEHADTAIDLFDMEEALRGGYSIPLHLTSVQPSGRFVNVLHVIEPKTAPPGGASFGPLTIAVDLRDGEGHYWLVVYGHTSGERCPPEFLHSLQAHASLLEMVLPPPEPLTTAALSALLAKSQGRSTATSGAASAKSDSPRAISGAASAKSDSPRAISGAASAKSDSPRAISGAASAKSDSPRAISGAASAKPDSPRAISGAASAKPDSPRAISGAASAKPDSPRVISDAASANTDSIPADQVRPPRTAPVAILDLPPDEWDFDPLHGVLNEEVEVEEGHEFLDLRKRREAEEEKNEDGQETQAMTGEEEVDEGRMVKGMTREEARAHAAQQVPIEPISLRDYALMDGDRQLGRDDPLAEQLQFRKMEEKERQGIPAKLNRADLSYGNLITDLFTADKKKESEPLRSAAKANKEDRRLHRAISRIQAGGVYTDREVFQRARWQAEVARALHKKEEKRKEEKKKEEKEEEKKEEKEKKDEEKEEEKKEEKDEKKEEKKQGWVAKASTFLKKVTGKHAARPIERPRGDDVDLDLSLDAHDRTPSPPRLSGSKRRRSQDDDDVDDETRLQQKRRRQSASEGSTDGEAEVEPMDDAELSGTHSDQDDPAPSEASTPPRAARKKSKKNRRRQKKEVIKKAVPHPGPVKSSVRVAGVRTKCVRKVASNRASTTSHNTVRQKELVAARRTFDLMVHNSAVPTATYSKWASQLKKCMKKLKKQVEKADRLSQLIKADISNLADRGMIIWSAEMDRVYRSFINKSKTIKESVSRLVADMARY